MDNRRVVLVGLAGSVAGLTKAIQADADDFIVTCGPQKIDLEPIKEQYDSICDFRDVEFDCDVNNKMPQAAHPQPFYRKGRW